MNLEAFTMISATEAKNAMTSQSRSQTSTSSSNNNSSSSSRCDRAPLTYRAKHVYTLMIVLAIILINCHYDLRDNFAEEETPTTRPRKRMILLASSHIVLTKDDNGQSLVLTGEDGKGGKGKGKGKGGDGDRLVIAGHGMGSDGGSNMVMQNAAEREGDVVINGNSMMIPGEDGHIVLADSRSSNQQQRAGGPPPNLWAFWMPFLRGRMAYNNPFFGVPFG